MMHRFTPEQMQFIRDHVRWMGNVELTGMVNERFGTSLTANQIKACKKNHHILSELTGHYNTGHDPHNKGMKGWQAGGNSAVNHFPKGHSPHNHQLVGTERVNSDDYVDIKIADPNKWKPKHRIIWEAANGKVPKGYAVIFGDRNRRNFDLGNLMLVTRGMLSTMNRMGLIGNDAESTRTGMVIAKVMQKAAERTRTG